MGRGLIRSFLELPRFLEEARAFGTNIVYLADYWQAAHEGADPPYWNKGDYIPRADLGGEPALIEGIRRVRAAGGRVILYLEPFIIYSHSRIAATHGPAWAGHRPDGSLYDQYRGNLTMAAPSPVWQDYVIEVATRFVRDYAADGIFLDSWAWQMNWPMQTVVDGRLWPPLEYSRGVLELTDRVRRAVKAINPDAVVIGDPRRDRSAGTGTAGCVPTRIRGPAAQPAAPRGVAHKEYGSPECNWFGNGVNLNELHQVFAARAQPRVIRFLAGHLHARQRRAHPGAACRLDRPSRMP